MDGINHNNGQILHNNNQWKNKFTLIFIYDISQ